MPFFQENLTTALLEPGSNVAIKELFFAEKKDEEKVQNIYRIPFRLQKSNPDISKVKFADNVTDAAIAVDSSERIIEL